jgi:hypothetical protein
MGVFRWKRVKGARKLSWNVIFIIPQNEINHKKKDKYHFHFARIFGADFLLPMTVRIWASKEGRELENWRSPLGENGALDSM